MGKTSKCPACGGVIKIPVPVPGSTIRCPYCEMTLNVAKRPRPVEPPAVRAAPSAHSTDSADPTPTSMVPPPPPGEVPEVPAIPDGNPAAFAFTPAAEIARSRSRRRPARNRWVAAVLLFVIGGGFALTAVVALKLAAPTAPPRLELLKLADAELNAGVQLLRRAELADAANWSDRVRFELVQGPDSAQLDAHSGNLQWTPDPQRDLGRHQFVLRAVATADPQLNAEQSFWVTVTVRIQKPEIQPIADLQLAPGEQLELAVQAHDPNQPPAELEYSLVKGPPGATLDAETGALRWSVDPQTSGGVARFTIQVRQQIENGLAAQTRFSVTIPSPERPGEQLLTDLQEHDLAARLLDDTFEHGFGGHPLTLALSGEEVRVIEYPDAEAASREARDVALHAERFAMPELPEAWAGPLHYFLHDRWLLIYAGLEPKVQEELERGLGRPLEMAATGSATFTTPTAEPPPEPELKGPFTTEQASQLLELYENKQLFHPRSYPLLRTMFADRFRREQAQVIEATLGGKDSEMIQWLNEHQDLRDELYTAIDPTVDKTAECLRLFRAIKEKFPDQIEPYGNLAIAIAVTWDEPKVAQRHRGPMNQAQAEPPEELVDALGNFEYYTNAERVMQGRIRFLPWEFLTLVVNHQTPLAERQWALQNYLARRVNYGACYKDVPYDYGMLDDADGRGRISGKPYTLPNLRQFGGVCAHQGDFAARVGKSLGVPAAYVGGQSVYGSNHAWVMWAELKSVTAQGIGFSLESFGRYRGDQYYVGRLVDPHTAQQITDRELELRLHTIGIGPLAKRQSDMVMNLFPWLQEELDFDVVRRFLFLRKALELCPGNEQAWIAVAKMSSDPEVRKKHRKDMLDVMNTLFATFARFPDFTLTVFDDLIEFNESLEQRVELYERLIAAYELQGRPDLACTARLRLAEILMEQSQPGAAVQQLAAGIRKFPGEGRYVPKMLDRLEVICDEAQVAKEQLVPFYHSFLPLIKQKRGDRASKYCIEMYERGIKRFQEAGQLQLVQLYTAELQQLRARGN